jgi:DNA-binding HxlR family transcriptional regulator
MAIELETGLTAFCPYYHRAVELIGKRWSGAIVRALLAGAERFTDLTAAIPGLSDRLLSERLKELETEGIVARTVVPSTPVRIQYRLTDKGTALAGVIEAISAWADSWYREGVDGGTAVPAPLTGRLPTPGKPGRAAHA